MKILVLTQYYPPEVNAPASRISELARCWTAQGHEVTIVTAVPNHPRGLIFAGYRNARFQEETIDGVRVIRIWTWIAPNAGTIKRTLSFVSYPLSLLFNSRRIPDTDVVISTTPQFFCGVAGLLLNRRPWVLEVRDLWPKSIVALLNLRSGPVVRMLEWIERLIYRKADAIVSVTDSFVPHFRDRGAKGPIAVIKNGVDLARFAHSAAEQAGAAFLREHGLEGKCVAAYVGTHGMAHGLDTVLDAAALLGHRDDIVFVLIGDGSERERLQSAARERGLRNVRMLDPVSKDRMPGVWEATDISLVVLRGLTLFAEVIPSKMFEAMAMRRPIVLGVNGEARELLEAAGAGVAITPESATELAIAVERLADDDAAREAFGSSGRDHVERHFDRAILAKRYIDLLESVTGQAGRET